MSWLTLWLLLLGTEDYTSPEQLRDQQAHRRPSEADLVEACARLAAVAAEAEVGGVAVDQQAAR